MSKYNLYRILGTRAVDFTDGDGRSVKGLSVFVAHPFDGNDGVGEEATRLFLTQEKLDALDFEPKPGQSVSIYFSQRGKVVGMELSKDGEAIDFG